MGLDTSHGCWHGAYSAFHRWRKKVAEVAGFGDLDDYAGFSGDAPGKPWPDHPLTPLLHHSDCEGEIPVAQLAPMADALEVLLPALEVAGDGGGHVASYAAKTRTFVEGLRVAASLGEPVEFR